MTIKQTGGIFGRNPEFNELTISDLTVNGQSDLNGSLSVTGSVGLDGAVVVNESGADVDFRVEGDTQSNLLFVDASTNRIGLNTSGPAEKLHLVDSDPKIQFTRTADFYYGKVSADGFSAFTNTNGSAPVILKTATTARLTVEAGGDVTVETGNLVIGTSGKGIDFSATSGTGTSELFDDYEEGTWTPVFNGVTGGNQRGTYTKVGDLVTAYAYMDGGTATAVNATVTGLPYTAGSEKGAVHSWHNTWTAASDGGWVAQNTGTVQFINDNSISAATAASGTKYCMLVAIYKT